MHEPFKFGKKERYLLGILYFNNMIDLDKYISEQLLKHLNIDYNIIENAGLYDGIEDLCKFLTNKIRSHQEKEFVISYNDSDIELKSMRNIFFKNIILKCERSNKNNNDGNQQAG